ncbi:hypothetical protein N2382_01945 [SAR92 clade bacterium H921]|nr:hypothetical protein [SAR92 clade bacterium H921]
MSIPDIVVFFIYLAGTVVVALAFMKRNKDMHQMFGAGGQVPWWVSGLSAFMTLFSAGSFVVWGGLAYSQGLVAVTVLMAIGVSGLIVGPCIAPRWKCLGIGTPADFVYERFGGVVKTYITWALITVRIISSAVALYALAAILDPLLFPGHGPSFTRSAMLISIMGGVVVAYTMIGGLWAVLMTDVLQFIILTIAVFFIVVVAVTKFGNLSSLTEAVPATFFEPISADFTGVVLVGWVLTHVFVLGSDWAFVQRHIAVPTKQDAKKSMILLSCLYFVSPIIWLAPAMFYRLIDANANPEQAYILISAALLPVGMLGLMAAAMFSATASMISSQINVFAGTLTNAFFPTTGKNNKLQLWAGKIMTVSIGFIIILLAIIVPFLGGAESVVFALMSLLISPIFAPVLWGLFSRRIGASAIWITSIIAGFAGAAIKFGDSFIVFVFNETLAMNILSWIDLNPRLSEMLAGVVTPLVILSCIEIYKKMTKRENDKAVSWFDSRPSNAEVGERVVADNVGPTIIVICGLVVCALISFALITVNLDNPTGLIYCGFILMFIAALLYVRILKGRELQKSG